MGKEKNSSLKKAFEMAALFQDDQFDKIQTELRNLEVKKGDANALDEIRNIVIAAGLKKKRADWLANYLSVYMDQHNDADTGW